MHVLILDHDHSNGLAKALQLSGYGLIVETVPDFDEAARRLSSVTIDAVLYRISIGDEAERERLEAIRRAYPDTAFYSADRLGEFLRRVRKRKPHTLWCV